MTRKNLVSQGDVHAFDLAELILYSATILKMGFDISSNSSRKSIEHFGLGFVGYLFIATIIFVFALVIFRNYIVTKSVDLNEKSDREDYAFVHHHSRLWVVAERLVRLLMICTVIFAPKTFGNFLLNPFPYIVVNLEEGLHRAGVLSAGWLSIQERHSCSPLITANQDSDCLLHLELLYYGSILFALAVILFAWDIVNVLGVSRRLTPSTAGVNYDKNVIQNPDYRSLLMYLNVFSFSKRAKVVIEDEETSKPQYIFCQSVIGGILGNGRELVEKCALISLYFWKSPKLRERLSLAAVGFTTTWASTTELNPLSWLAFGAATFFYFYFAHRNQEYLADLRKLVRLFIGYFGASPSGAPARPLSKLDVALLIALGLLLTIACIWLVL